MSDQANAVAPEEAMLQFLGGDEEEREQEAQDQAPEEVEVEEPQAEQETEEDLIELTYNGEQLKKSKSEILELAQKGFDYTQKTQSVAEQRRQLEAQAATIKQQFELREAVADTIAEAKAIESQLKQYEQVDWNTLIAQDPVQAMQLDRQFRELRDYHQQKSNEVHQKAAQLQASQEAQRQEMLVREHQSLLNAIPEWRDASKAQAERGQLRDYLLNSGFDQREVDSLADHKAVIVARKAMLYDALMAKKPEVQNKVAVAPKPVKPGATPQRNPKADEYAKLRDTAKKSGRIDHAAAAVEKLL